jgi:heat-inducible transcriptional repressor
VEQRDLDLAGSYLSTEFHGKTLTEIRDELHRRISQDRAAYDRLVAARLELGRRAVEAESAADVFVDGASNLLATPEFADPGKIKALMQALERKRSLVDLLSRVIEDGGIQVVIGEEQPSAGLADCSLVATSYGAGGRVMGTLGIVGPKRMEYARTIALVGCLAGALGRFFSASAIDDSGDEDQVF